MEILRAACPLLTDDDIVGVFAEIDSEWLRGFTLADSYASNAEVCETFPYPVGELDGEAKCLHCFDTIAEFVYLDYRAGETPPPPTPPIGVPPVPTLSVLVAYDGQFLGNVNDNAFDPDSLANRFGTYGSTFNSLSIWNQFGTYGSEFNSLSPWNSFTTTPPCIIEEGACVLFVTANTFVQPSIHPNDLAATVGRSDVLR